MQSNADMKSFVLNLLKANLSPAYFFHDYAHTQYVVEKVIEIGEHEGCTKEEIKLLIAAALFHDTGYMNTYTDHEEESCALARKYLPDYGYSKADINTVCEIIMATKTPQSPQNKLEEIIADADLEYLGTENAGLKAHNLFLELHHLDPALTKEAWRGIEISFIQQHRYFTNFCKENKEPIKQAYLKTLLATGS